MAVFLASDASSFVTGPTVVNDGGLLLAPSCVASANSIHSILDDAFGLSFNYNSFNKSVN